MLEYKAVAEKIIIEKGLAVNSDKLHLAHPGERWEFLGFSFHDGIIDLAESTVTKIKFMVATPATPSHGRGGFSRLSPPQNLSKPSTAT